MESAAALCDQATHLRALARGAIRNARLAVAQVQATQDRIGRRYRESRSKPGRAPA